MKVQYSPQNSRYGDRGDLRTSTHPNVYPAIFYAWVLRQILRQLRLYMDRRSVRGLSDPGVCVLSNKDTLSNLSDATIPCLSPLTFLILCNVAVHSSRLQAAPALYICHLPSRSALVLSMSQIQCEATDF